MTVDLPFMKNVITPLAKSILVPSGLTAVTSATDAVIQKKLFESGTTTLVFSNECLNNIMKIVKSLEEFGLLIKGVSQTVENETKEQKGGILSIILGKLVHSLLGNMLAD